MMHINKRNLHLGDLTTFMIPAEDGYAIPITHFQQHQERDGLKRIVSPIDVVSHKQVVRLRTRPPDPKKLCQVVKLTMDIATYGHWGVYRLDVRLLPQNFLRLKLE
jgi:hypothetical protein